MTLRRLVTMPIVFYRRYISPRKAAPCCKYLPTCSEYAIQAIEEWGVVCGLALAAYRILRCNPFSKGGYDPVPRRKRKDAQGGPECEDAFSDSQRAERKLGDERGGDDGRND